MTTGSPWRNTPTGRGHATLNDFFAAVRGKIQNRSTLEQGMLSTAIAEAAERSREENRVVLIG